MKSELDKSLKPERILKELRLSTLLTAVQSHLLREELTEGRNTSTKC